MNHANTQVTVIKRHPKTGRVSLKTYGWKAKKETFIIKGGDVTFVSITYRRKGKPVRREKANSARRSGLRQAIQRCLKSISLAG